MTVDSSSTDKETGYLSGLEIKEEAPPAQEPADAKPAAESSPAAETTDAKAAESSDADATEGAKAAPKSILDAVQAAMKKDEGQEQPPGSKTSEEKPAEGEAEADKAKAEKDGEQLPFHNHPRWKEVTAENRALKEKAGSFDQFLSGVAEAGLSVKEFNDLLGVGALIKHNPEKALAAIEPVVAQLKEMLGEKLTDTLVKRVADGEISEADARDLSRTKARADLAERQREQAAEQSVQSRRQSHLDACDLAANTWESTQAASDPDWAKKQPLVKREAEAILREHGIPPTIEDAVKVMKLAKQRVDEYARSFQPARPKTEAPVKTGGASATHAPAPKSIGDAVRLAMGL